MRQVVIQRRTMRNSESAHAGLLVLAFLFAGLEITPPLEAQELEARLYYFWQEGCPHCTEMSPWLDSLEGLYPGLSVSRFEVRETPGSSAPTRNASTTGASTRFASQSRCSRSSLERWA
ncbi:MAG: hypothetical protein ACOC1I_07990 [Spirochaetota bacterium]